MVKLIDPSVLDRAPDPPPAVPAAAIPELPAPVAAVYSAQGRYIAALLAFWDAAEADMAAQAEVKRTTGLKSEARRAVDKARAEQEQAEAVLWQTTGYPGDPRRQL